MRPSVEAHDDAGCIADVLQGNTRRFEDIVRRYQKPLYHHVQRLLKRHEDIDDILQETFVRAYQHLAGFDCGRPLYPWLRRIAFNLAITHLRAAGRLQPLEALPDDFLKDLLDPQQAAERAELQHAMDRAIAALPADQQTIVNLQFRTGLSYQEISQHLQIPLGTVMSRLARAKEKLRAELHDFHVNHRLNDESRM